MITTSMMAGSGYRVLVRVGVSWPVIIDGRSTAQGGWGGEIFGYTYASETVSAAAAAAIRFGTYSYKNKAGVLPLPSRRIDLVFSSEPLLTPSLQVHEYGRSGDACLVPP